MPSVSCFKRTPAYIMTDRRSARIRDVLELNGNTFNPDTATDVQRTQMRNAIIHMGIVDRSLDRYFHHRRKTEALNNLADMLTHEKPERRAEALVWQLENTTPEGRNELQCAVNVLSFSESEQNLNVCYHFPDASFLNGCTLDLVPCAATEIILNITTFGNADIYLNKAADYIVNRELPFSVVEKMVTMIGHCTSKLCNGK